MHTTNDMLIKQRNNLGIICVSLLESYKEIKTIRKVFGINNKIILIN